MTRFRTLRIALGFAVVVLMAGCGGGSSNPDPGSLITSMKTAVNAAQSVHMSGSILTQGHVVNINMSFNRAGEMSGTVSDGAANYQLLVTAGKMYIAPNLAYIQEQGIAASECAVLCGKYADVGSSASAPSSIQMSAIFKLAFTNIGTNSLTVAGRRTINGQSAWLLTSSGGTAYIAVHGKPYLLRLTGTGTGDAGTLNFSQWNAVLIPGPPSASQMVDESKLPG